MALVIFDSEFQQYSLVLNVNDIWKVFKNKVRELAEEYALSSITSSTRRKDKPWFNREVRKWLNKERRLYKKF